MILKNVEIEEMEPRYRAAFINSLSGFKAANLVGTCDASGQDNLAIMSSTVHLGSNPPLLAMVMRPRDADQHTLANILDTKHYTLNHVHRDFFNAAHQTAARYPNAISEFEAVGLTPTLINDFPVPFVAESNIRLGMQLREHQVLRINGANLVIGEIMLVDVPDQAVEKNGGINIAAAGTVTISGIDSYHSTQCLGKLPYAKVK